jgi:Transposase DDE domain group 1
MARGAQELRCSCRPVWPGDRPCARPKATPWHRARHGFKREPDPRQQEKSVWNGYYACTCYHPLFVFNQFGDLERCALRAGNVHSADGWDDVLKPVVALPGQGLRHLFSSGRAQSDDLRTMCAGSMPISAIRPEPGPSRGGLSPGRVASRRTLSPRRLHRDRQPERVVAFYNKRGTCEQWIKEGKGAIKWTRLSCRMFAANAVRLQLHVLAYNLGN